MIKILNLKYKFSQFRDVPCLWIIPLNVNIYGSMFKTSGKEGFIVGLND